MASGFLVFVTIFFTVLWCLFGAGTITLIRSAQKDKIPKVVAVAWPILLILAAFGLCDESDS